VGFHWFHFVSYLLGVTLNQLQKVHGILSNHIFQFSSSDSPGFCRRRKWNDTILPHKQIFWLHVARVHKLYSPILQDGWLGSNFRQGHGDVSWSSPSHRYWDPSSLPFALWSRFFPPGVNRPKHDTDHSGPPSTEKTNALAYVYIPRNRLLGVGQYYFHLLLLSISSSWIGFIWPVFVLICN
jgi:hypothetical protein